MPTLTLAHAKEALETLDTDKILSAYANPFLFIDSPSSKTISDSATLRAYFDTLFHLPDTTFSDIKIFETTDFAAIEWTWSGTSRSSNSPFRILGASVIELSKGKIARETLYYDPRPALS